MSFITSLEQFDETSAKQIGKGAFGVVKTMKKRDDGQTYALKCVNIALIVHQAADDEEAKKLTESLFNEALMMKNLDHPNIVKVFGSFLERAGDTDGTFYIAMELCEGGSLRSWIYKADANFAEDQVLHWTAQVLNGLKFLHERRIMHQDIKSDNLLLDSQRKWLKIGDFGVSKALNKTALGTSSNMPPEIVKGEPFVWQSDVWSLGVVVFEMCARRLPFSNLFAIANDNQPIPSIPAAYSIGFQQLLIDRMLVRDPTKRATVAELCESEIFRRHHENLLLEQLVAAKDTEIKRLEVELERFKDDLLKSRKELEFSNEELRKTIKEKAELRSELNVQQVSLKTAAEENAKLIREKQELMSRLARDNEKKLAEAAATIDKERLTKRQLDKKSRKIAKKAKRAILNNELKQVAPSSERATSRAVLGNSDLNLVEAAMNGDVNKLRTLLANGADQNSKDDWGNTALMWAARNGHLVAVIQLLAKGADVNRKSNYGWTALIYAARYGHLEVVTQLLAVGADVNIKDCKGKAALILAARFGHLEIVSHLLAKGAKVNSKDHSATTALILAARYGHQEVVSTLLAKGAGVNNTSKDGSTALLWAARNGHLEVVTQLLAKRADVNRKSNDGKNAVILSAENGHLKVLSKLLENGADFDSANNSRSTDLIMAARKGNLEVVYQLLEAVAVVDTLMDG